MEEIEIGSAPGFNVLVVEDSPSVRAVLMMIINMGGMKINRILEAEDGEKALEVLNCQPIDIVFTDINMPRMNGVELVDAMRLDPSLRSIPVVAVTFEKDSDLLGQLEGKVHAIIEKPFKPGIVLNTMRRVLDPAPAFGVGTPLRVIS